jgi:hypothetical protein
MTPRRDIAGIVCRALRDDVSPISGYVRYSQPGHPSHGHIDNPRRIWVHAASIWVQTDGRLVEGWIGGAPPPGERGASSHRFNAFDAWRIRRAIGRWAIRPPHTPVAGSSQ